MSKKKTEEKEGIEEKEIQENEAQDTQSNGETESTNPTEEDRVAELEVLLQESKDKHLRLFAEFENFKKRTFKESLELRKTASIEVLNVLLPVLDDFDRAKNAADDDNSTEHISDGVLMVYNKLYRVLSNKGLKPMESTGKPFDPELHEAITEIPAPNEEMKGKIVDTVEKGYYLNEKIIRFAKVVVGK